MSVFARACVCGRVRVHVRVSVVCCCQCRVITFRMSQLSQMMDFKDLVVVVTLVNPDSKDGSNFSLVCASRS